MKWIIDHLLVRGINHFVPHAFSMSNYPDGDCPPHFYAGGNNPMFGHFAHLMKYTNRLCNLLNDGVPSIQVGILYHGEAEWAGNYMKMQKPARKLSESQIDYLFVSNDMLVKDANVQNDTYTINSIDFKYLIVPFSQFITKELLSFIQTFSNGKIFFIGDFPERVIGYEEKIDFSKYDQCSVVALEELPNLLKKENANEIKLSTPFEKLVYTHYCKENYEVYVFNNEDEYEVFNGSVTIPEQNYVYEYNPFKDNWYNYQTEIGVDRSMDLKLSIAPNNLKVLVVAEHELSVCLSDHVKSNFTNNVDISSNWNISIVRSLDYPNFEDYEFVEELTPISRKLPNFSGIIRYEKDIDINEKINHAQIEVESVYDGVEFWINGVNIGKKINPPYSIDFSGLLVNGKNKIVAEVSTTTDREVKKIEEQFIPMFEVMEPTGMFGKVRILY